jgi:hypothetical protein
MLIRTNYIAVDVAHVHYVSLDSLTPAPPFASWDTAATNIQDAVDAANPGDEVVVTNGVHNFGSKVVNGSISRVAVTRQLLLRSVNGPGTTAIDGSGSVRCVFLMNGATLTGFTLTNGAAGDGGGVYCNSANTIVSNCVIVGNSAPGVAAFGDACDDFGCCRSYIFLVGGYGGGACGGTLKGCVIAGNSGTLGGGAYDSILDHCSISNNVVTTTYYPPLGPVPVVGGSGGGVANSTLSNCRLTGNRAESWGDSYGGGADQSSLTDCILARNSAPAGGGAAGSMLTNCVLLSNSAGHGGGVAESHPADWQIISSTCPIVNPDAIPSYLYRCLVTSNSAAYTGGGSASAVLSSCLIAGNTAPTGGGSYLDGALENCTVVGNTAGTAGGVFFGSLPTLDNCIVMFNTATNGPDYFTGGSGRLPAINYTCITPLPTNGFGNFSNAPMFVDAANGNFHLQSNSPCINAGDNVIAPNGAFSNLPHPVGNIDLDGNSRIVGGTVDVGAYEFQSPQSLISYQWLQHYGLPIDGSADYLDADADGMNSYQEWRAGTDPTSVASALRMLPPVNIMNGVLLQWQGVAGKTYAVERSTNLLNQPAFQAIATDIPGQSGLSSCVDTNAPEHSLAFYRIRVE